MKYFILFLTLIWSISGSSQELPFLFKGEVFNSDENLPEKVVSVSLEQNNQVVSNVQTLSNGKYTLRGIVDLSMPFQVKFVKSGFVQKFVQFDMTDMNEEDAPSGDIRPIDQLNIRIFKERENLDFGFLENEPVVEFEWDPLQMGAMPYLARANKMKSRIEKMLLEDERNKANIEKKYNQAILTADAAYTKGAYIEALEKYEEALSIKPRESHPLERISELDALILAQQQEALAASQERQAFDNLISAADNLRDQKDFETAIAKYKEALKLRTDEQYPKDQVAILSAKIVQAKKEAERQKSYDAAIQLGESFLRQKSFKAAKDKFQEASDLKPSEELPKTRLKEIALKHNEAKAAQAERERYKKVLAEADALFDTKSYKAALAKYEVTLEIEPSSTYAKTRKNICEEKVLEQNQKEQKAEKIKSLMASGDAALMRKAYQEAITSFKAILEIDAGQLEASNKLQTALQKNDVKTYTDKGDANLNAKKYQSAIDDYLAANAIIPSADLTNKIETARKRLDQENALAIKKKKYEELILSGDASFKSGEWIAAKTSYTDALNFTTDKAYVQGQLSQIEKNIANERMASKRKSKFEKLMLEGQAAFDQSDWSRAISNYTEALEYANEKTVVQTKIDEVKSIQAQELVLSKERAKVALLLNEGKADFKKKEYSKAKEKYEEVLSISASNETAQIELEKANAKIIELQNASEKEKLFQALKREGYDFANEKKYNLAKEKLTQALDIKDDTDVRAKMASIDREEKAMSAQLEKQQIYDELIDSAEVLAQNKEYENAIEKYREALEIKPTETKPKVEIQALEKLKNNALKQLKIEEKYNQFMEKGEYLISRKKYLEAIVEFNKALAIKPNEKLPVDRAAEAERLSKESTSELERLVDKNLNVAQKKLDEKNFDRALQILENTEKLDPKNTRLKSMRQKINTHFQKENDYLKLMADASTKELAEDYVGAKADYAAANLLKPQEQEPIDKLEELRTIIEREESKALQEKLYSEHMSEGKKAFENGLFDVALSEYQEALDIRKNDVEASARVDEVQQVLDNLEILNAEKQKNQNRFDTIVRAADKLFNIQQDYVNAKIKYEAALVIFPSNDYVKLQIDECANLQSLELEKEREREYRKVLSDGDVYFGNEQHDAARERYATAALMRPQDTYPKTKLDEIESILNPQLVELDQLEDLGTPFEGSILDGQFLLAQAEEERKLLNKLAIGRQLGEVEAERNARNAEMTEAHYERSSKVAGIQADIRSEMIMLDDPRNESLASLRASEVERSNMNSENARYEYAENSSNQDAIYTMNKERSMYTVGQELEFKKELDRIDDITAGIENASAERNLKEIDDKNAQSVQFSSVKLKLIEEAMNDPAHHDLVVQELNRANQFVSDQSALNQSKEGLDRIKIRNTVDNAQQNYIDLNLARKEVSNLTDEELKSINKSINEANSALTGTEDASHYETATALSAIRAEVEPMTLENTNKVVENNQILDRIKLDVLDEQSTQYLLEEDQVRQTQQKMNALKVTSELVPLEYEEDHRAVIDALSDRKKDTEDSYGKKANEVLEERVNVQAEIDKKTAENTNGDVAKQAHVKKVAQVRIQNLMTAQNTAGIEQNDRLERLNLEKNVNEIYTEVALNSTTVISGQSKKSERLATMQKTIETKHSNQLLGKQESLQKTAREIYGINNNPEKKKRLANSLGEDYPEGVSEESFTQNDSNGKMKAIITRRIVVIDGHADVYVRTQTVQAITFTKNGNPSLQHVWNIETQGPHLERHF
ncbi:hypothetical protein OAU25_00335 [Crocinitomicaceae bacterium]|nr:hypothetical protein [Crocinitomicaceae bacterium]